MSENSSLSDGAKIVTAKETPDFIPIQACSNAIRGERLSNLMDRVLEEIHETVRPELGPGAGDAILSNEKHGYYTRDGKECLGSLRFDDEAARYIHHFFYQPILDQGDNVGDGTTTMAVFYYYLYRAFRDGAGGLNAMSINGIRRMWKAFTEKLMGEMRSKCVELLTDERLASMLYTCTQDRNLSAAIYAKLKADLMAGAYIYPRVGTIDTELEVTANDYPHFRVTKHFSLAPMGDKKKSDEKSGDEDENSGFVQLDSATILYCRGSLNISHWEVLLGLATAPFKGVSLPRTTVILLCHGFTEQTRESIRNLVQEVRIRGINVPRINNVAIYTLDDYRKFSNEELDDVGTVITDIPGNGTLTRDITYENLLYNAFYDTSVLEGFPEIDALRSFDIDRESVERIQNLYANRFPVDIDEVEGMVLRKSLGKRAEQRLATLKSEIDAEGSSIRKEMLNERMRRCYGRFIDVEVGAKLLKDTQRRFELVVDALVSSSQASSDGVIVGNSVLHMMRTILTDETLSNNPIGEIFLYAGSLVMYTLIRNFGDNDFQLLQAQQLLKDGYEPANFNLNRAAVGQPVWPSNDEAKELPAVTGEVSGTGETVSFPDMVVEPANVILSIIEKSYMPIELAKVPMLHVSAPRYDSNI